MLGAAVTSFAYPNGIVGMDCGEREARVARRHGVRMAFTTEARHLSASDDCMQVPRIGITDRESLHVIHAKFVLGAAWSTLKSIARTGEYVQRQKLKQTLEIYRSGGRVASQAVG
jgi:hypothetical protein